MDRSKDFILGEPLTKQFSIEIGVPMSIRGMLGSNEARAFGLVVDNVILALERQLSSPTTIQPDVSTTAVKPFHRIITMSWATYKTLMTGDLTTLEADASWFQQVFQQLWSYVRGAPLRQVEVTIGQEVVVLTGRDRSASFKDMHHLFESSG